MRRRTRIPRYPWPAWFRRDRFTLRRGRDYRSTQATFGQQIRNAASRLGCHVTVEEGEDSFTVIVRGRDNGRA